MRTRAALIAFLLLPIGGCMYEDLGGGITIRNQTQQQLEVDGIGAKLAPGDAYRYEIDSCSTADLDFLTRDGEIFAQLTEKWCKGETWVIKGPDEVVLDDEGQEGSSG